MIESLLPLLLVLPLAGFVITAFIGRRFGKRAHLIPVGAIFLAWIVAMLAVISVLTGSAPLLPGSETTHAYIVGQWSWIPAGAFHVDLGQPHSQPSYSPVTRTLEALGHYYTMRSIAFSDLKP